MTRFPSSLLSSASASRAMAWSGRVGAREVQGLERDGVSVSAMPENPRQLSLAPVPHEARHLRAAEVVPASSTSEGADPSSTKASGTDLFARLAAVIGEQVAAHLAEGFEAHVPDDKRPDDASVERWLTVEEVAGLVRTCRRTVYRALHSGELAGEKVGPLWRIRPSAVAAWAKPMRSSPRPTAPRPAAAPSRGNRPRGGAPARDATSFKTRARAGARERSDPDGSA